jgi:hypothetical protein
MGRHEREEPTELELEQQRAGYTPEGGGDLFDQARTATWLPSWAKRGEIERAEEIANDGPVGGYDTGSAAGDAGDGT